MYVKYDPDRAKGSLYVLCKIFFLQSLISDMTLTFDLEARFKVKVIAHPLPKGLIITKENYK